MSSFANVTLLATDGSREAGQAARMAVELSRSLGSELHAVYVEPLPRPYAFPESTVIDPALGTRCAGAPRKRKEQSWRRRSGR
jgi:nucleotide-binding universal stress UspA family protein